MGTPSLPGFGGASPAPTPSWFGWLPRVGRLVLIGGAIVLAVLLLLAVLGP